jgi:hypothetical protein
MLLREMQDRPPQDNGGRRSNGPYRSPYSDAPCRISSATGGLTRTEVREPGSAQREVQMLRDAEVELIDPVAVERFRVRELV